MLPALAVSFWVPFTKEDVLINQPGYCGGRCCFYWRYLSKRGGLVKIWSQGGDGASADWKNYRERLQKGVFKSSVPLDDTIRHKFFCLPMRNYFNCSAELHACHAVISSVTEHLCQNVEAVEGLTVLGNEWNKCTNIPLRVGLRRLPC